MTWDRTWDRTWAAVVGSLQLTAWSAPRLTHFHGLFGSLDIYCCVWTLVHSDSWIARETLLNVLFPQLYTYRRQGRDAVGDMNTWTARIVTFMYTHYHIYRHDYIRGGEVGFATRIFANYLTFKPFKNMLIRILNYSKDKNETFKINFNFRYCYVSFFLSKYV